MKEKRERGGREKAELWPNYIAEKGTVCLTFSDISNNKYYLLTSFFLFFFH